MAIKPALNKPLEIFFSYAHEDEDLMDAVRRQLIVYERNGRILKWHDRMIPPGEDWRNKVDTRLEDAKIILLFMSPHFIESHYCYDVEGERALQRHEAGTARVIPIVLRPCSWEDTPFGDLQAWPAGAKPISVWPDRDVACLDAARGVMKVVDELAGPQGARSVRSEPKTVSAEAKLVYCRRCGHKAGKQSVCTGSFTAHDFYPGLVRDFCSQCGVRPGTQTICTGSYTHHSFARSASESIICTRCGAAAGEQTICIGSFTHHAFSEM